MESASAQSSYQSPLYTKGSSERAVHLLGLCVTILFKKFYEKKRMGLFTWITLHQKELKYSEWKLAISRTVFESCVFFFLPPQAEVLSRNQRYLWGRAEWESGSLGFCRAFTEVILQLFQVSHFPCGHCTVCRYRSYECSKTFQRGYTGSMELWTPAQRATVSKISAGSIHV